MKIETANVLIDIWDEFHLDTITLKVREDFSGKFIETELSYENCADMIAHLAKALADVSARFSNDRT